MVAANFDFSDARPWRQDPEDNPDPLVGWCKPPGGPGVAPAVTVGPSSARWLRRPDEKTWHVMVGPEQGPRRMRCEGSILLPTAGEAVLPLSFGGVFGPACGKCGAAEGLHDH